MIMQQAHDHLPLKGTLLYANRDNTIVFAQELDQAAKSLPDLHINYIVDPQRIDLGTIKAAVKSAAVKTYIYLSGPKPMVGGIEKELIAAGFDSQIIKTDYFPGYDN
jgi:ferredoxin-NADP reductase